MDKSSARGPSPRIVVNVFLSQKDKTQAWLARQLHVSESHVSYVIRGRSPLTPEFVTKFRAVTGIDLAEFPRTKAGRLTGAGIAVVPASEPITT